jgi:pimeloyl-ACP methyl ester carboxylesterase
MRPYEERIQVGGIDVHTWVGGEGDPLLVLHGAGGNRGWRKWMERMAERYTVWAPTHPGFGTSGAADWMEGVDDLARFYLWFIEAARLGQPHLLGQSFGGWTAAEMATMSPGAIDRLVLAAPVGVKPEQGEILDVFYHSPQELRTLNVHDPASIPEWEELFGQAPTPAELEIAERNREMTARLERFLPRVTNPTLIVWGREDRIIPASCGEQYRRAMPNATLTVLGRCGHLIAIEQPEAFAKLVLDFLGGKVRR